VNLQEENKSGKIFKTSILSVLNSKVKKNQMCKSFIGLSVTVKMCGNIKFYYWCLILIPLASGKAMFGSTSTTLSSQIGNEFLPFF